MSVTSTAVPSSETWALTGRDEVQETFTGRKLGSGSSRHPSRDRWFEVDIYRASTGEYVLHTRGMSTREGEKTYVRIVRTRSSFEVIELLTVHHNGKLYLPRQSSRALAQAAQWDDGIREAYVNRAVT